MDDDACVLPLARLFLTTIAARTGSKASRFTPAAAQRLLRHLWPGNVRELENAVERDYIGAVLRAVGGNRTQAAAKLGIGPATLYRKLKQYGS